MAAAHSHSLHGKTLASMHEVIWPITQDSCAFYNDCDCSMTSPASCSILKRASGLPRRLGDKKAIILANHGPLTVGTTVESAVWWFITLDRSANAQLIAMAAGGPKRIDDENAAITYNQIGNELAGGSRLSQCSTGS